MLWLWLQSQPRTVFRNPGVESKTFFLVFANSIFSESWSPRWRSTGELKSCSFANFVSFPTLCPLIRAFAPLSLRVGFFSDVSLCPLHPLMTPQGLPALRTTELISYDWKVALLLWPQGADWDDDTLPPKLTFDLVVIPHASSLPPLQKHLFVIFNLFSFKIVNTHYRRRFR